MRCSAADSLGASDATWARAAGEIEQALRGAVREIFPCIVVDLLEMWPDAVPFVVIAMRFRSPLSYSEGADWEDLSGTWARPNDTALMLEMQMGMALVELFGAARVDDLRLRVNALDQAECAIVARVPARLANAGAKDTPGAERDAYQEGP